MTTNSNMEAQDIEKIIDYVFQELPDQEEQAVEDWLDNNEVAAQTADDLLRYCRDHGIRSKAALKTDMAAQQAQLLQSLEQPQMNTTPKADRPMKKTILISALVVLAGIVCWCAYNILFVPEPSELPIQLQQNFDLELAEVIHQDVQPYIENLGSADGPSWEKALEEGDYATTLTLAEAFIAEYGPGRDINATYVACTLNAIHRPPNLERAQVLYRALDGERQQMWAKEIFARNGLATPE